MIKSKYITFLMVNASLLVLMAVWLNLKIRLSISRMIEMSDEKILIHVFPPNIWDWMSLVLFFASIAVIVYWNRMMGGSDRDKCTYIQYVHLSLWLFLSFVSASLMARSWAAEVHRAEILSSSGGVYHMDYYGHIDWLVAGAMIIGTLSLLYSSIQIMKNFLASGDTQTIDPE